VLTSNGATAGDIGYINEAGLLCIVGRKNNMIIRGGQNVYPEEVEALLKEFPFVEDAVVVGNDDAYWGEQIIALVQWSVAVRDERHYVSQLRRHCRKYLATYKRPHTYVTVAKFPYTTSGKIDREKARTLIGSENYEYTSNR
ncbi:MAG TPA: acyl-CoA synthetase, partial [Pseudogracilibacillus sp.]|nr:acyl-CoA synthetase [Pseudogracilibacillus sp.]